MQIDAAELVRLARRRRPGRGAEDDRDDEASLLADKLPSPPVRLCGSLADGDLLWEVTAEASVEGDTVTLAYLTQGDPRNPSSELVRQARGEGFCAAYLLSLSAKIKSPRIRLLFFSPAFPEPWELREEPKLAALERFIKKLFSSVRSLSARELDRVSRRLSTMESVRFPYPSVREGQRELISACYRAICRGERLYASAPTGIGKTASVLFPAVRALGGGYCDKIFYLTSKNTTAEAAADAVCRLARAGADIRALRLTARERICRRGLLCRGIGEERCALSRSAEERMDLGAEMLLELGMPVVDSDTVARVGEEAKLCPYELSLRYALECDVVICDYNYLFDPRIALSRFFSRKGNWCFLIDEAHNLVDRSRELYSAELSLSFFDSLRPLCEKTPALKALLAHTKSELRGILAPYLADSLLPDGSGVLRGFWSGREMPPGLSEAILALLDGIDAALDARELSPRLLLENRDAYYALADLSSRLSLYSERYLSFLYQTGDEIRFRALCLDPSELLSRRLSLGRSAVLFSATFTPVDYYRAVLGGGKNADTLELPSPFDPSRLCVAVMDKIPTRYTERASSLSAVARAILTAVKAKPGNYLVFTPSFAYLAALADEVARLAPGVPLLRQSQHMTAKDRESFLARFSEDNRSALIGFSVLGGIFSEGIDLSGRRLIGAIIVGVAQPIPTPEREAIRAYYDDEREAGREFAYVYPGMNRVLQAAGRVIRQESDRGVVLLIDDRFAEPVYRELIPTHWRGLKYAGDLRALETLLRRFWAK
jgi:DNA excision repair protein ERCC-2